MVLRQRRTHRWNTDLPRRPTKVLTGVPPAIRLLSSTTAFHALSSNPKQSGIPQPTHNPAPYRPEFPTCPYLPTHPPKHPSPIPRTALPTLQTDSHFPAPPSLPTQALIHPPILFPPTQARRPISPFSATLPPAHLPRRFCPLHSSSAAHCTGTEGLVLVVCPGGLGWGWGKGSGGVGRGTEG